MSISLAEGATAAALIVSVVSLLNSFYLSISKIAKMELKIDTIWDFQMRRALSESVSRGVATVQSPVTVTDEAKRWMQPLLAPIQAFYAKLGRHLTDRELSLEIERRFGQQILHEVCIPHQLDHGACLIIAIQAVREATDP